MKCPLLHGNIQKETDRETEKSMLCNVVCSNAWLLLVYTFKLFFSQFEKYLLYIFLYNLQHFEYLELTIYVFILYVEIKFSINWATPQLFTSFLRWFHKKYFPRHLLLFHFLLHTWILINDFISNLPFFELAGLHKFGSKTKILKLKVSQNVGQR